MSRSDRMFEIIQLLRQSSQPVTAANLAQELEVTKRTVYRDVAALQAQRVPIEGEAGIGYILRPGFDLPPLMFTSEEIEAISVGLALLGRSGDAGLIAAAERVTQKVSEVLPGGKPPLSATALYVSGWNKIPSASVNVDLLRRAIRDEAVLKIRYCDEKSVLSERKIRPLALIYYTEAIVIAAWCESRDDFRHFRLDRVETCEESGNDFKGKGAALRQAWERREDAGGEF